MGPHSWTKFFLPSYNITYRSILILLAIFFALFYFSPYQRGFHCSDNSIKYPFQPLLVSAKWLLYCTIFWPLIGIYIVQRFLCSNNSASAAVVPELVKFCFGFLLNLTFTELVKRTFGRLRPHTYSFCNLNRYCPNEFTDTFVESFTCENPDALKIQLTNVRLSFFSGHSSLGSFAGTYIVFYLHQTLFASFTQFSPIGKCLACITDLIILVGYLYPGYTQWLINWHFASDVLTGFSCGAIFALFVFHNINRNNNDNKNNHTSRQQFEKRVSKNFPINQMNDE